MFNNFVKYFMIFFIWVLLILISFASGQWYSSTKEKIKIVKQTKVKFRYIKSNVNSFDELSRCYYSELKINGKVLDNNYLKIYCFDDCKEATTKFQIASSGNWRYYIGIGLAGMVVGGYMIHKLK